MFRQEIQSLAQTAGAAPQPISGISNMTILLKCTNYCIFFTTLSKIFTLKNRLHWKIKTVHTECWLQGGSAAAVNCKHHPPQTAQNNESKLHLINTRELQVI